MARPMGFYHRAVVKRNAKSVTGGTTTGAGPAIVIASLPCRIGPMSARQIQTIFGEFSSDAQLIEWGTEVLKNGDLVEFEGVTYKFQPLMNDQYRPSWSRVPRMQTGTLVQDKKPRG